MNMYLSCDFHKLYQVDGGPFQSEDLGLVLVQRNDLCSFLFSALPQEESRLVSVFFDSLYLCIFALWVIFSRLSSRSLIFCNVDPATDQLLMPFPIVQKALFVIILPLASFFLCTFPYPLTSQLMSPRPQVLTSLLTSPLWSPKYLGRSKLRMSEEKPCVS